MQETRIGDIAEHLKKTLNLNGLKYMGDMDKTVTKVALVGHLFPNCFMQDGVVNELLSDVANAPKVTYIQTEDGFNYV